MHYLKFAALVFALAFISTCANRDTSPAQSSSDKTIEQQTLKSSAETSTAQELKSKPLISNQAPSQSASPKPVAKAITTQENNKTQSTTSPLPTQTTPAQVKRLPPTVTNVVPATANIKGKITLLDTSGKAPSPEGAIVELKRINSSSSAISSTHKNHEIDTRSKTYIPGFLTVKVGDTLVFKNFDGIKHNVFSSSGKNTFDLGTYGYNKERDYIVNNEGIIKVYCNIHPEMALFVSASKDNLSFITDKSGEYIINNIAPGKYTLSVWHLRGTTEKIIDIKPRETKLENVNIDISSYKPEEHLNKHGETYKKKPAIFKDEFY